MNQPELICRKILEERTLMRGYFALKNRKDDDDSEHTPSELLALEYAAEVHLRKLAALAEAEAEGEGE